MKVSIKLLLFWVIIFASSITFSQEQQQYPLRLKITNTSNIPDIIQGDNGRLTLQFSDDALTQVFSNYDIFTWEREFPSFLDEPVLKDMYHVTSSSEQLAQDLINLNIFEEVMPLEIPIPLGTPSDYTGNSGLNAVNITGAWGITEGSPAVKIGIVDTPILDFNVTNAALDLECQLEYERPNTTLPSIPKLHGTIVATIASGTPNNGISNTYGGAGVGYNSRLYMGSLYGGAWTTHIQEFVARGARVINLSFTTGHLPNAIDQLFITKLAEKGVIIVAAAGNGDIETAAKVFTNNLGATCTKVMSREASCFPSNSTVYNASGFVATACFPNADAMYAHGNGYLYPASYDNVISVSGTDLDSQNLFLNYPNNVTHDCDNDGIADVGIVGTLTLNDKVDVICPSGAFATSRVATSYAAPVVSGVVALMLSVNPELDVNDVITIFNDTGLDIQNLGTNTVGPTGNNSDYFQNGTNSIYKLENDVRRLDAYEAVLKAKTQYDDLIANQTNTALFTKELVGAHVNDGVSTNFSINPIYWVDYDNDNDLDIYNGSNELSTTYPIHELFLYENLCDTTDDFSRVQLPGFLPNGVKLETIGWGDIDNDGDKDYLGINDTTKEIYLYTNTNGNAFIQSTVATIPTTAQLRGARIADFNNDGQLDFMVGHRFGASAATDIFVYQGNGDGTFTPVSNATDLYNNPYSFYGISVGDINNDGNQDIATIGFQYGGAHIFLGDGNFGFDELPIASFLPVVPLGYGINLVDYDNDLDLDIYIFGSFTRSILLNNLGNNKFLSVEDLPIANNTINVCQSYATWGDYDNDGDQDLYAPELANKSLYRNTGGVHFEQVNFEITNNISEADHETTGAAFGDADNDGDLDLYVNNAYNNDFNNYMYVNDINEVNTNSWLTIKLEGAFDNIIGNFTKRTSVSAEGTKVIATIVDASSTPDVVCNQMRYVNTDEGVPHDIYFGFGDYAGTVDLTIEWPSGLTETINGVSLNERIKIIEQQGIVDYGCDCSPELANNGTEIAGTVGFDTANNCNCDDDNDGIVDYPLEDIFIQLEETTTLNTYYTMTDMNGDYAIPVLDGTYDISPVISGTAYDIANNCNVNPQSPPLPPANYTVTVPPVSLDNDFCLTSTNCALSVTVFPNYQATATSPCPDITQEYCMYVQNNGQSIQNPVFQLQLDPNLTVVQGSATSTCGTASVNASNTVSVSLNAPFTFGPQDNCLVCVTVLVDGNNFSLGDSIVTTGSVNGQCSESTQLTETVTCSFDPNDLVLVTPESCGAENNIDRDEMLLYRIRFQNEGNAPAVNVVVKDLLDTDLDFSTFKLIDASHEITNISILPDNNLIFEMNDIQLPYKDVDEPGSKGYILFGMYAKSSVPEGTKVDNVASIYFDLNAAIVTNSTTHTLRTTPFPSADFDWQRTCNSFDIMYDFNYTGSTPDNATYQWDFGTNATPSASTDENPTNIEFGVDGPQQISLIITRFGCQETITKIVEVTSPLGCNGNPNKVLVCKKGNEICVSKNAAETLVNNFGYCVGHCDENKGKIKKTLDSKILSVIEKSENPVVIFPNPSSGLFTITLSDGYMTSYEVYNVIGQVVKIGNIENSEFVLDATNIPSGVYFIKLTTSDGYLVKRIVKSL